jgi:hypothetical protein
MMEAIIVCVSAAIVFVAVLLRMNNLYFKKAKPIFWSVIEVSGLVLLLAGCAGVVGERFLPHEHFHHAKSLFIFGVASSILGVSRGTLCQVVARLRGWDGSDRRSMNIPVDEELRRHA